MIGLKNVFLLFVAFASFSSYGRAAIDLAAASVELTSLGGGTYSVTFTHNREWTGAQADFTYKLKVVQIRAGQVIATPIDDDIGVIMHPTNVCQNACVGQSCSGSCFYKMKTSDPWYEGSCGEGTIECAGLPTLRECTCKSSSHQGKTFDIMIGDTLKMTLTPGTGVTESNLTNNTLTIAIQ